MPGQHVSMVVTMREAWALWLPFAVCSGTLSHHHLSTKSWSSTCGSSPTARPPLKAQCVSQSAYTSVHAGDSHLPAPHVAGSRRGTLPVTGKCTLPPARSLEVTALRLLPCPWVLYPCAPGRLPPVSGEPATCCGRCWDLWLRPLLPSRGAPGYFLCVCRYPAPVQPGTGQLAPGAHACPAARDIARRFPRGAVPTCTLVTYQPLPSVPSGEVVWLTVVPVFFLVTDGAGHVSTCIGRSSSLFLMFKSPCVPHSLRDL